MQCCVRADEKELKRNILEFGMIKYYTGCRNGNRYTGFWLADIVSFIELHTAVTILMLALKSFCSMSKLALTPNYRGLSPQVTT